MKLRKIFNIAAVLGMTFVAVWSAGCSGHTHSYVWQTVTAATCVEGGTETGYCDCGDITTRETAPDPDAHSYGAWEVTKVPTDTETGLAVKTCLYDSSHTFEFTLPVLGDSAYETSVTVDPTAVLSGTKLYIYAHELGDIRFSVDIEPHAIESVEDAIEVAVANKGNVRYASGKVISTNTTSAISYRYGTDTDTGDSYTYINDGADNVERWLTRRSDGSVVGFYKTSGGSLTYDTNESSGLTSYVNGYRFVFTYTENTVYYGAETLLAGMYEWAKIGYYNAPEYYSEEISVTADGDKLYKLNYGYKSSYSNFALMSVEFTLTPDNSLGYLYALSRVYLPLGNANNSYGGGYYLDSATGYYKVRNENGYAYKDGVELTQETSGTLGSSYVDTAHISDYTPENSLISSFSVLDNGKEIEDYVTMTANVSYSKLSISNILPSTSSSSADPISIYIQYTDGTVTKSNNQATDPAEGKATIYISSDYSSIILKSAIKGYFTLIFETVNCSREVLVYSQAGTPSSITPNLYLYNANTGEYYWTNVSTGGSIDLYCGESVIFKAYVKYSYLDSSITRPSVTGGTGSYYSLTEVEMDGDTAYEVVFSVSGTYTVQFYSAKANIRTNFVVNVADPPAIKDTLVGTYYNMNYDVTVTFDSADNLSYNQVLVTITQSDGSYQRYVVTFNIQTNEIVSFVAYDSYVYYYEYEMKIYGDSIILNCLDEFGETDVILCEKVEED